MYLVKAPADINTTHQRGWGAKTACAARIKASSMREECNKA